MDYLKTSEKAVTTKYTKIYNNWQVIGTQDWKAENAGENHFRPMPTVLFIIY